MSDDARTLPPAEPRGEPITIEVDGQAIRAFAGEPVAVALYAAGVRRLARSPKYHRPRGLFCAEGHCGSCQMRIAGSPNVRACVAPASAGLRCERQNAFPDADVDLLRAADWLFPEGMDHHTLMTGSRIGNELFVKLVRQMGGTGLLPDAPAQERPAGRTRAVDVCVVGAGPAGLGAARRIAEARPDLRVVVYDEQDAPGGSLLAEPGGVARGRALAGAAAAAGVELTLGATAIAFYPRERPADGADPGAPDGALAIVTPTGLVRLTARRIVYATGAYDQNLPFADNDRPGVLSARAAGRLAFRWGVRPGRVVHLLIDPARPFGFAERLREGLVALGVSVEVRPFAEAPRGALREDAIAVAAQPAPASELPRQHGIETPFDDRAGGFAVPTAARRGDGAVGVYTAGDVNGWCGSEAAAREGEELGAALAATL